MNRYTIGVLAALALGTGAALATPALVASAHTPALTCSVSGTTGTVTLNLANYPAHSTVSGVLDGANLGSTEFGPATFHQSTDVDLTVAHTYDVTVTGSDGQGNAHYVGTTADLCSVPLPTSTPTSTPTPTDTPSPTDTPTAPPTDEPTSTPSPTDTPTSTPSPTDTPTDTPTTPAPVILPQPTAPTTTCVGGVTAVTTPTVDHVWWQRIIPWGDQRHIFVTAIPDDGYAFADGVQFSWTYPYDCGTATSAPTTAAPTSSTTAAPVADVTASTSPSATAAATTPENAAQGSLAYTGAEVAPWAGAGLLIVVAGLVVNAIRQRKAVKR